MKRLFLLGIFILAFSGGANGQATQIASGPVDPPLCNPNVGLQFYNTTSKVMKYCSSLNKWKRFSGDLPALRAHASQKDNGPGGLAASGCSDDGTNPNCDRDFHPKGPNPYINVTAYGVRAVRSTPRTTCTMKAGSATATLPGGASAFVNGDGFNCRGAGATLTLSTPRAPTVVASNASNLLGTGVTSANSSGATTYQYCVAARTIGGGLTPCSPVTSIANGPAALGATSVNVSSWTRSNNTVTVTTATAINFVAGSIVKITGDGGIQGWYQVATATPGTTSFTFLHGNDTRNGAPASGTTGGVVTWFQGNHITWAHVANAWQYYVYGRTAGGMVLLGVSLIDPTTAGLPGLASDPTTNEFDDWGSPITTAPGVPSWVPSTPPTVAKNDDLVTTIVSGAGTTKVTLATNAINSVTAATALFDNTPNIVAAALAATGNKQASTGVLFFPADVGKSYVTSSVMQLNMYPAVLSVMQGGAIAPGDTMVLGATTWVGWPRNAIARAQFGWEGLPTINSGAASPIIYNPNSDTSFSYVQIGAFSANAQLLWLCDAGGIPGSKWDHVQFTTGGTSDFSSQHLIIRNNIAGGGDYNFSYINFVSGPNQKDIVGTPLFQNTQGMGPFTMDHIFLNRRGMYMGAATTGIQGSISNIYCQGCSMPKLTVTNNTGGVAGIGLDITNSIEDTTFQPILAYLGSQLTGTVKIFGSNAFSGSQVSGNGSIAIEAGAVGAAGSDLGQNKGFEKPLLQGTVVDGIQSASSTTGYAEKQLGAALRISAAYPVFIDGPTMTAPTCSVKAGGTAAVGSYTFRVAPVFATGGEGILSPSSTTCTTTKGNQTITVNWSPVSSVIGYDLYKNGFSVQCTAPLVNGLATSYVWSGAAACGQSAPKFAAAGPTAMTATGLFAPALRLVNPSGVGITTLTAPNNTADRAISMPDAAGTVLLNTTLARKIFIPGCLINNATTFPTWNLPASNAATFSAHTGRNVQECTLDFADGQNAQYGLLLPSDWQGAIDARAIFFDSSTSGTVVYQIATACTATSGSSTDDRAFNAPDSFATITLNATANAIWETTKARITTTGCSAGNKLQIKLSRTTDTAAGVARLVGLELTVM